MTRIVAGSAKGRRLAVPAQGTRPTSERAREALFNSLAALADRGADAAGGLAGARVLDLFAGSGAVGLEALSRGASSVILVESDRAAATLLRRNVVTVGLPGAEVRQRSAAAYLSGGVDDPFDLVFVDPPYAFGEQPLGVLLATLGEPGWLAVGAIVVVERAARGQEPRWPDSVEQITKRRYGDAMLWYGRRQ
jgi:16S rRNA (guanine966-N2)-methyltransferase